MFTTVPSGSVEVPLITGVLSLPKPSASTVTIGVIVSTLPLLFAVLSLPAASVILALTVKSPCARAPGISMFQWPSLPTRVSMVCTAPALSVMVSVTVPPISLLVP